jgi:hypothetical protein
MPRLTRGVWLAALGLVGACALLVFRWSGNAGPPAAGPAPRGDFAAGRAPGEAPAPFDARRAMGYLEALCKIGPRISGTDGMRRQQELLEKHFKGLGGQVSWQRFEATQHSVRRPTPMANLVVSWHPDRPRRVLLCSHYDTRPIADQEPDPRRWREPFLSANDGGSGVALLMELAHHVKDLPTSVGIDFAFFDGEEYVFERNGDEYFFGSKQFAREYRQARAKDPARVYLGAVLLDMVGGKDARFPVEQNSWFKAERLVRQVWGAAEELGCSAFRPRELSKVPVEDDHIPLNQAGIPAVDVIDFDYPHWHRLTDVPENCSGESLDQVARVLSVWVQRVK